METKSPKPSQAVAVGPSPHEHSRPRPRSEVEAAEEAEEAGAEDDHAPSSVQATAAAAEVVAGADPLAAHAQRGSAQ